MTTAVILAAGQGQRLKPLTCDRPKGMVRIAGQTIIERQLRLFDQVGIDHVVIVKGFCAAAIPPDYGARHYTNEAYETTNMVYSLFCAQEELASADTIIVSYGDIVYSQAVLQCLLLSRRSIAVVVDLDWKSYFSRRFGDPYIDAESLTLAGDGRIVSIGKRTPLPEEVQAQYIGLMKFDATGLTMLRHLAMDVAERDVRIGWGRKWRQAYMTDLLQELVNRGAEVHSVEVRGGWCEVDSLRDHEIAEEIVPTLA